MQLPYQLIIPKENNKTKAAAHRMKAAALYFEIQAR